jgi:type IV pilus assembly protein PilO
MELSLTKLPWYAQVGAFVVLALIGCGAFYYLYEMPYQAELDTKNKQLQSLKGDIQKGLATAKQLPEFRAQVDDLENRLSGLKAVLPDEKDAADLLRRMQSVAVQSNLTIKGFKPSPTVTKTLHAEWPISLQLDGTYHNLAIFLDRVGKFTRIVNVSSIDIKGVTKPTPTNSISATCVATTFVLLDKPQATPAAGRGGRGAPPKPAAPAGGV